MPIPKPQTSETHNEFIQRCMSDDVMVNEYPDEEQRYAVCNAQKVKTMTERLTTRLEIKTLGKREFEGYGSIFGNVDYGNDAVMPGAFKRTLAEHKADGTLPMMFWMHDPSRIPGKWLEMEEDSKGLYVKGVLADTDLGNEIHTLLGMKAVSGMSIGYMTRDRDYTDEGVRQLKDIELFETSIVSIPMNPKAQIVHAKSRLSERGEYVPDEDELALLKRDCEHFLRCKGFSRKLATVYVSNLFRDSAGDPMQPARETREDEEVIEIVEKDYTSVTPDEIEVNAGLASFQEKLLMLDLERRLAKLIK